MNKIELMLMWLILKRKSDDLRREIDSCGNNLEQLKDSFVVPEDARTDEEVNLLEDELNKLNKKQCHLKEWTQNLDKEILPEDD